MGKRSEKITAWVTDDSAYWQVETMQGEFYGGRKLSGLSDDELTQFFNLIQRMTKALEQERLKRKEETSED